jgi:glycerophosphoryl diester phosphodiesterase
VSKSVFKKLLLLTLISVGIVIVYLSSTAKMAPQADFYRLQTPGRPLIFSHQGGEGQWPCNTLFALRESAKIKADVLDIDVHLNQNGHFYAIHDATVDRTTNGHGSIADLPSSEIEKLDAGHRFSPDGKTFPYRNQNLRIPELEELFREFPTQRFGIELKTHTPQAAKALAEVIAKNRRESTVLISCFDQHSMDAFRIASPNTPTSASTQEVRIFAILAKLHLTSLCSPAYSSLQVPISRSGWTLVSPQMIKAAHSKGIYVIPWTINENAEMQQLLAWGVDGINTNFPSRLVAVLATR